MFKQADLFHPRMRLQVEIAQRVILLVEDVEDFHGAVLKAQASTTACVGLGVEGS